MTPADPAKRTNICLNMIVKNETKVLGRMIQSVKDAIDYYVIVDTGSTDGTQELIRKEMGQLGIAGEIHERPWVNFGTNRQQALELAVAAGRSDWLLFIDADEELKVSDSKFYEKLTAGVTYNIEKHHESIRYAVPHLLNVRAAQWRWEGPVHNYLVQVGGASRQETRKDIWIHYHSGQGAKSHGMTSEQKYLRDAKLLEEDLKARPGNARSQFYLGQSYKHAGHLEKALGAYRDRVALGGWEEERFMAQLEVGRVCRALGSPESTVVAELLAAYQLRPRRAEPLHELASYFRLKKQYAKAYVFAKAGCGVKLPTDALFVSHAVYSWQLLDELGVSGYWAGFYEEAHAACLEILKRHEEGLTVPAATIARIRENLRFSEGKLKAS